MFVGVLQSSEFDFTLHPMAIDAERGVKSGVADVMLSSYGRQAVGHGVHVREARHVIKGGLLGFAGREGWTDESTDVYI